MTRFPNGLSSYGVPVLPAGMIPRGGGKAWFVDGLNGNDGNTGDGPDQALATIAAAVALMSAGDTVFIYATADYAEAVTVSLDDISFVGVCAGGGWIATIAPASGVALTVSGINFRGINLQPHGGGGTNAGVLQTGDGFYYSNCDFISDGGVGCRLRCPNPNTSGHRGSQGVIENSRFRYCGGAGLTFENAGDVGITGVSVRDCIFAGNTAEDILDVDTGGSNDACFGATGGDECEVIRCRFLDRNKAVVITLTNGGGNAGLIADCDFAHDTALDGTKIALSTGLVVSRIGAAAGVFNGAAL